MLGRGSSSGIGAVAGVAAVRAAYLYSTPYNRFSLAGNHLSRELQLSRDYLHLMGVGHIFAAPYHPQTNVKLERYYRSLKDDLNHVPYEVVRDLEAAIRDFVAFYNEQRYYKALGNVTPADVLAGHREAILASRKEVHQATWEARKRYHRSSIIRRAMANKIKPISATAIAPRVSMNQSGRIPTRNVNGSVQGDSPAGPSTTLTRQ